MNGVDPKKDLRSGYFFISKSLNFAQTNVDIYHFCTGARERFLPRGGPILIKNIILRIFEIFTI